MNQLPTPLPTKLPSLRLLYAEKYKEGLANGLSDVAASARVRKLYPSLISALNGSEKPGGLNVGRTGLGVFSVGNDDGPPTVQAGWDRVFPTPMNDRDRGILKYIVGILGRLDPPAGTMDAETLKILSVKLEQPTVKDGVESAADAAAEAVAAMENSRRLTALANCDDLEEIKSYARDNGLAVMVQDERGVMQMAR